jgi:hypothetical protein
MTVCHFDLFSVLYRPLDQSEIDNFDTELRGLITKIPWKLEDMARMGGEIKAGCKSCETLE